MTDQDFATQRSRSPTYPYLNLSEAINLLEKFVQSHRFTKVPLSIALKDMGYSITSGTGARVTASITQFGLFEIEGSRDSRRVWVSDLGRKLVMENPNKPGERLLAIQEAALKPDMHQWVYNRYDLSNESLPTFKVLTYDLQRELGFPEKSAEIFAKEFIETFEFSRIGKFRPILEEPDTQQYDAPTEDTPQKRESMNPPEVSSDTDELTNRLTEGKIARLILPKKMNRMDFRILAQWLDQLRDASLYEAENDSQRSDKMTEE